MAQVTLEQVEKVYPDGTRAVCELSLDIGDGELMVFVGPSGCGKTTALRMIAGLEEISAGEITIGERVVNRLPPKDRDVAMVFQSYALYPHKTVYDNMAFPLKLAKRPKSEIDEKVRRIAALLELEEHLDRKPRQLSGGQRQRVAMGRAIVREPQAFLMDEPLSNLDAKLRTQMRAEVSLLHRELGVTTVYVTHDQVEAMTLGERVAVMRKGVLQQVASPQELYNRPASLFVAGFIGSPSMNFLEAEIVRRDGSLEARFGNDGVAVDETEGRAFPALERYVGRRVILGVRPEHVQDAALVPDAPRDRRVRGLVRLREELGSEVVAHLQVEAAPVLSDDLRELAEDVDSAAVDELEHRRRQRRSAFVARFGSDTQVHEGATAEAVAAPGALRFFDPDTGAAIAR